GDHPDELVLARVPVPLARPGPVGQAQQVDPELVQPDRVAQPPAPSRLAWPGEFLGIARPVTGRGAVDVDLRHGKKPSRNRPNPLKHRSMSAASHPVIDPVELTRDLIRRPSVTPADEGAMDLLERLLTGLGFHCRRMKFG